MPAPTFARLPATFLRVFGEAATYTAHGATPRAVRAVYQAAYREALPFGRPLDPDSLALDDAAPTAWMAERDAPTASNRDRLEVGGKMWRVVSVAPDGYGMTRLTLAK